MRVRGEGQRTESGRSGGLSFRADGQNPHRPARSIHALVNGERAVKYESGLARARLAEPAGVAPEPPLDLVHCHGDGVAISAGIPDRKELFASAAVDAGTICPTKLAEQSVSLFSPYRTP
jgi:hypothetical protein